MRPDEINLEARREICRETWPHNVTVHVWSFVGSRWPIELGWVEPACLSACLQFHIEMEMTCRSVSVRVRPGSIIWHYRRLVSRLVLHWKCRHRYSMLAPQYSPTCYCILYADVIAKIFVLLLFFVF